NTPRPRQSRRGGPESMPDDMRGRLNRFQRAMPDWNDLHPYNAVHVVRVPAALELPRLRQAIQTTLENWGLTNLSVNRGGGAFQYGGGPVASELTVIGEGGPEGSALTAEIERQLNAAFYQGQSFDPFRF